MYLEYAENIEFVEKNLKDYKDDIYFSYITEDFKLFCFSFSKKFLEFLEWEFSDFIIKVS